MESTELQAKKKIPAWALIAGAILLILLAVGIFFMVTSGSRSSREIKEKLALADRYMTELNYEQAIAVYDQILQIDPKNTTVVSKMADAYVTWAKAEESEGNVTHALEILAEGYEKTKKAALFDEREALAERNGVSSSWTGGSTNGGTGEGTGVGAAGNSSDNGGKIGNPEGEPASVTVFYDEVDDGMDPYQVTFDFEYDDKGNLLKWGPHDSVNHTEYTYDEEGNLLTARYYNYNGDLEYYCEFESVSDGKRQYRYKGISEYIENLLIDEEGNLILTGMGIPDDMGNPIRYETICDQQGRILSYKVIYDTDQVLRSEWNGSGMETVTKNVSGYTKNSYWAEYIYDEKGTLVEKLRHKDITTEYDWSDRYEYASNDEWTVNGYFDGKLSIQEIYSANGLKRKMIDYDNDETVLMTTDYTYNAEGDVIREDTRWYDGTGHYVLYKYDGNTVAVTNYGLDGTEWDTYEYEYYKADTRNTLGGEGYEVYSELSWMISNLTVKGQTKTIMGWDEKPLHIEYEFDAQGRVSQKTTYSSDRTQHFHAEYEY